MESLCISGERIVAHFRLPLLLLSRNMLIVPLSQRSCSYPFGYSLTVAAVYAQNPSTVSYILDNLSQSMDTDDTACLQAIYGMFHDAITTSFRRGNPAMATSLLEWFSENVPMPRKEVYNSCEYYS